MFVRACVWQGTLLNTIRECRPTVFFGVPRVWEKFQERVEQTAKQLRGIKRILFQWARGVGLRDGQLVMNRCASSTTHATDFTVDVYCTLEPNFVKNCNTSVQCTRRVHYCAHCTVLYSTEYCVQVRIQYFRRRSACVLLT